MINQSYGSSLNFYQEKLLFKKESFRSLEERLNLCNHKINKRREKFKLPILKIEDSEIKINSSIDSNFNNSHLLIEYNLENELIKQISIPTINEGKKIYKGFCIRHDKKLKEINKMKNLREFNRYFSTYFDGHDVETADHRIRVGCLSSHIFNLLRETNYFRNLKTNHDINLNSNSREFENILHFAAMNHDDGKIFIPYEILNKPSSLTENEFKIMKKHSTYGQLLLDSIPGLEFSQEIANYHHENFNGSGYLGLSDGEIPISAQITSFVDIFDALTTPRVYRNENFYSYDKVYSMLFEGFDDNFRGKSYTFKNTFDPNILEIISKKENWNNLIRYHQYIQKKQIKKKYSR